MHVASIVSTHDSYRQRDNS